MSVSAPNGDRTPHSSDLLLSTIWSEKLREFSHASNLLVQIETVFNECSGVLDFAKFIRDPLY